MNKYTRFFEATSPSFLFESIYVNSYNDLKCCSIKEEESVIILFENLEEEKCQNFAVQLFKDKKRFNEYYKKFENFLGSAEQNAEKLIKDNKLIEVIELFMEFLGFYRYTESFYTELSYKICKEENDTTLNANLIQLEKIKTQGRKFLNLFFNGKDSYFSRVADKSGDREKFLNSSVEELKIGKSVSQVELNKRKSNHILKENKFYAENTVIYNEIKEWKKSLLNSTNILKGTPACKGSVTGNAFVLSANFENFDELDNIIQNMPQDIILVSETTAPDIIRACYKAKAIVTNQGGLGSHAAITSRELKIPCVVGTKIATNIIKTGDLITVDGNKGVVILNEK